MGSLVSSSFVGPSGAAGTNRTGDFVSGDDLRVSRVVRRTTSERTDSDAGANEADAA